MKNQLDQIIERHQVTPAPTFRSFTKEDWYAFAGCESDDPQIAEHPNPGDGYGLEIVVDGSSLCILRSNEDGHGHTWSREFKAESIAMAIGRAILLAPDPSPDFLFVLLGHPVCEH